MDKIQVKEKLVRFVKSLDEDEANMFAGLVKNWLEDVGFEHHALCLSQRPHSHSADCDCGADELATKFIEAVE